MDKQHVIERCRRTPSLVAGAVDRVKRSKPFGNFGLFPIASTDSHAYLSAVTSAKTEYSVTVKAIGGDEFTISKSAGGEATRTCVSPLAKTGCGGDEKGNW